MNNFTYENTKDAELIKTFGNQPGFEFYKSASDAGYLFMSENTGFKWATSVSTILNAVKLSRPFIETRDYWTTNGNTKYAQPQGNKMNIKTLIPISHVKKFTPLVVGDVLVNINNSEILVLNDEGVISANNNWVDRNYSLVSFADRPNTGTQPVGDDVVVDCILDTGKPPSRGSSRVVTLMWDLGFTHSIKSWKPNKDAMLKQYQAEQLEAVAAERLANLNEDSLISHADMVAKIEGVHIDGDGDLAVGPDKVGVATPVFTEEFLIGGGTNVLQIYKPGKLLFKGSKYSIFVIEGGKEYSRRNAKLKSRPIQTAEDKAREVVCGEIIDAGLANCAGVNDVVDMMFSSDKFTITLNEGAKSHD